VSERLQLQSFAVTQAICNREVLVCINDNKHINTDKQTTRKNHQL